MRFAGRSDAVRHEDDAIARGDKSIPQGGVVGSRYAPEPGHVDGVEDGPADSEAASPHPRKPGQAHESRQAAGEDRVAAVHESGLRGRYPVMRGSRGNARIFVRTNEVPEPAWRGPHVRVALHHDFALCIRGHRHGLDMVLLRAQGVCDPGDHVPRTGMVFDDRLDDRNGRVRIGVRDKGYRVRGVVLACQGPQVVLQVVVCVLARHEHAHSELRISGISSRLSPAVGDLGVCEAGKGNDDGVDENKDGQDHDDGCHGYITSRYNRRL